ncbi:MAG: hypothetical protein JSW62_04775 [Thermoplasmatales archaeon]|nr:MAG: hypothetical protein JSW62_04775 [Thermoplasmatales archaeon]
MDFLKLLIILYLSYFLIRNLLLPEKMIKVPEPKTREALNIPQRNNNPGNLKFAGQKGAYAKDKHGHAIFRTINDGWNALYKQIDLDKNRGHTLKSFIKKYAPFAPDTYLPFIVKKMDTYEDVKLYELDTERLALHIATFEGFYA